MTDPVTVAIVDDHPLVRAGLRALLEDVPDLRVVAEASDGDEVPALVAEHSPDVLLMDLSMARVGGVEATRALRDAGSATRVVVLTSYSERARVQQALFTGNPSGLHQTRNILFESLRTFGHRFDHGLLDAKNIALFYQFGHQLAVEQNFTGRHTFAIDRSHETL